MAAGVTVYWENMHSKGWLKYLKVKSRKYVRCGRISMNATVLGLKNKRCSIY